ncbi:sterol desaturase family protein [Rhizobium lusitanum]|jgi:sterol desaturase/sphingolipid hydroxylase (fatty acid hydroxylase superfamily)|uniref:Sterol desaturase/sphingolipid hydroxylase, fatty acid hydroxylase superfamily n=1 Tax=Rhizobium lusitanum TaxID=293958 RepID=A0A1C3UNF5_9HYPH|nr:sterol desaturase family protein [Rhizobium lusitanum]NTJ07927.1 sterol desaturase family protein [Rhizobium lusitanum]SCB17003.1 Sterol desaturase/sphingolipid hydroxylase, fatty acid hydroxylase superfamily [Rhizobium lusitanum]
MTFQSSSRLYAAVSSLLWPAIFCAGLTGSYFAFHSQMHLLWFNVVYLSVVATIALFERLMPYEETWLDADGETFNNLAHTLLSKGAVQIAAAIGTSFPMAVAIVAQPFLSHKANIWPDQLPMALQVVLGLIIAEFGLYLAHRLAHEHLSLWRFHALHHSVERLWVINTGRFHIIDSLFKIALSQIPLYLLGAPLPVFLWIGAVTAFIGLLTHCNIDVRTGPLDWILSTPRLHRWHHSKLLAEGNTNYGENLVIWDQILGTYYNPPRPSSIDIGITGKVADSFLAQLVQPFSKKGAKQIIGKKPKELRDKEELAAKAAAAREQANEPIRKSS